MIDQRDEAGFTLVELLIVIVVLGVLAGIVVLGIGNINQLAWVSDCQSDGANVDVAIQNFHAENLAYPTSQAELLLTNPTNGSPFIGSWPANTDHYTFTLSPANDGTFTVSTPANRTGLLWTGAKTCSDPSLKLQ